MDERFLNVFEVGKKRTKDGILYPLPGDLQKAFLKTQEVVNATNKKQTLKLEVVIEPDKKKPEIRFINYKIIVPFIPEESSPIVAEVNKDGKIISTAERPDFLGQIDWVDELMKEEEKLKVINGKK
ncbi:MAG: hypothetical protein PVH88_01950 [Ignavibacteria bacterium]|jgi:hypothetical protein